MSDFFSPDDAVLLALSGCDLHHLVRLAAECEVVGMSASTSWFMSEEGEFGGKCKSLKLHSLFFGHLGAVRQVVNSTQRLHITDLKSCKFHHLPMSVRMNVWVPPAFRQRVVTAASATRRQCSVF